MKNTSSSRQNISSSRKKVYVGMSGGVDSSVSALLLKEQGYDVTGVFIKVWQPDTTNCGWKDERRDAMRVAAVLDIPFLTFDFSEQYKREVVDYMIEEYSMGRTPNPDVMCNRHVKFGSFLQKALADGVDYVATGHYAQNIFKDGRFEMKEGADSNKDQSYFLWTLTQEDLKHVLFPIGHLEKPEVRKLAEKAGLPVFDKKDSQGVCFIGHLDMKNFLKEHIKTEPGDVIDESGNVVGRHDGVQLYTIGERHGFTMNIAGVSSEPHFIVSKDLEKNTLTVAAKSATENSPSHPSRIHLKHVSLMQPTSCILGRNISARIRYRQEKQSCAVELANAAGKGSYIVTLDNPQKGMAEGQSVVLYDGNTCLGGGILNFI